MTGEIAAIGVQRVQPFKSLSNNTVYGYTCVVKNLAVNNYQLTENNHTT